MCSKAHAVGQLQITVAHKVDNPFADVPDVDEDSVRRALEPGGATRSGHKGTRSAEGMYVLEEPGKNERGGVL